MFGFKDQESMGSKFESNTQKSTWDSSRNIMQESEQTQLEEESKENVWKKIYYDKKEIHQEEKLNYLKDHFGQRTKMPYSAKKKGKKEEQRLPKEYFLDPGIQVGIEKDIKESEQKIGKNPKQYGDFWSLIEEIRFFTQTGGSQEEKNSGKQYFLRALEIQSEKIKNWLPDYYAYRLKGEGVALESRDLKFMETETPILLDLIEKIKGKLEKESIFFSEHGDLQVPEEKEELVEKRGFSFKYNVEIEKKVIEKRARFVSREEKCLFEGIPKVADIHQGHVNDCYFLSALTTIVAKDPGYIMQAMKDNADGTVTVRFYKAGKPVYVTVKKKVPVDKAGNELGAQRSLWVQMMERAFAAFAGKYKIEGGRLYQEGNSYNNIDFGTGELAIEALYGAKAATTLFGEGSSYTDMATLGVKGVEQEGVKSSYNPEEVYKKIDDYIKDGKTIAPISYAAHIYAILGCQTKDGKNYVRMRNPYGGERDLGEPKDNVPIEEQRKERAEKKIQKEKDGIFLIESSLFFKKFAKESFHFYNV